MIETEFQRIEVKTGKDDVCLRIEEKDSYLNLCWLNGKQLHEMIGLLQEAERRLIEHRVELNLVMSKTNFTKLYNEFENRFNPYPVQMSRAEAFGKARAEGLIDEITYEAAADYYGKLWFYVGD